MQFGVAEEEGERSVRGRRATQGMGEWVQVECNLIGGRDMLARRWEARMADSAVVKSMFS